MSVSARRRHSKTSGFVTEAYICFWFCLVPRHLLLKIWAQRKAAWRQRARRLHLSFFSFPRSLAFHHKSLACLSRFALVSVQKTTKTPEEGQVLGPLLIKASISTFTTCRVSWRHIGHSLNTQITKRRKLTRRFDIPQKQPTVYNKDLPLVRLSFGSFIDTRKKLRDSGIHL